MIIEINQDIFEAPVDIIFQCANCFNAMGAGIAKEIVKRFPEVKDADEKTLKGDKSKLGTCSIAKVSNPESKIRYVFSIYGQYNFGAKERQLNYEALYRGLEFAKGRITNTSLVVGIPYGMGAGLAGGNFRIVKTMIEEVFKDSLLTILICKKNRTTS